MVERRRSRADGDRGAVLILAAVAMTALMVVVALVVDLGLVRQSRRASQAATDLAALAGGEALGADPAPDGRSACSDAVDYLQANIDGLPAGFSVPCSTLPAPCGPTTAPVTVTDGGTGGDFAVSITFPVPDSAINDADVPSGLRLDDGVPCERLEVSVDHTFDSVFGGILGRDRFAIDASAVVRQVQASDRRVPSLWLLDPTGCVSLSVSGGSNVTVGTSTLPGLVTIDSDASSCGGNSFTIDTSGAGSRIQAVPNGADPPAQISLVAMERLQADCATGNLNACDPADVSAGYVYPQPVRRANRATRAPVDWVYNCKPSYPDYHGIKVAGCDAGTPPSIDNLRAQIGTTGTPSGYQRWSTTYGCNNPTVPATGLDGNWHVDCGTFKITSANVVFNGGNVVFDGEVSLTGGSLTFNAANPSASLPSGCMNVIVSCVTNSSANAAFVYMRNGDLQLTGGALNAYRTMIYQHNGFFSVAGGSPPVWTAPTEGPFAGLAVWSEKSSNKFKISGGASMRLEGTFFTPEAAPMSISGGAPVIPQQAQFVSYQLAISGGASLTLAPNETLAVTLPADPPLLIR